MKNKKLVELSKKITLGKIKKLEKQEILTIYAGKNSIIGDCVGDANCHCYWTNCSLNDSNCAIFE